MPLGDEARVEVDVGAHRVVAHVLDAAREHDVGGAHRDLAGAGRDGRQRAGAHAVDGEAGNGVRDPGEQRDVAAEGQALVADLRGRGEDDVADALGRDRGIAAQQLAHDLDGHVVGARPPEERPAGRPSRRRSGPRRRRRPRAAAVGTLRRLLRQLAPRRGTGALDEDASCAPGFIVAASSIA